MQIPERAPVVEVTRAFRLTNPTRRDLRVRWANGIYVRVTAKAGRGVQITFEGPDRETFSLHVEDCPRWLRRALFRSAMRASRDDTVVDHRPPEKLGGGPRRARKPATAPGRLPPAQRG